MLTVRSPQISTLPGFSAKIQGQNADTSRFFHSRLLGPPELLPRCAFNILHVCDYVAPYANYDAYYDYPGHLINSNVQLADRQIASKEIARRFNRPFMGGLDRHGIIGTGTPAQVEAEIRRVVKDAPPRFILGADCTVEADTSWDRLRHAIATAHQVGA